MPQRCQLSAAAALLMLRYSVRQLLALHGSTTRTRCDSVSDPCVCTTVSFGLVLKGRLLQQQQLGSGVRLVRGWCTSKSAGGCAGCWSVWEGRLTTRQLPLFFMPSSYSSILSPAPTGQPSAPAVPDSVQGPEVPQPGTRPPRCSSRRPFRPSPKTHIVPQGRKGLDAHAAGPHRAP